MQQHLHQWLEAGDRDNLRPRWQRAGVWALGVLATAMMLSMAFSMSGHAFETLSLTWRGVLGLHGAQVFALSAALLLGLAFFALYVFSPLVVLQGLMRRDGGRYRLQMKLREALHTLPSAPVSIEALKRVAEEGAQVRPAAQAIGVAVDSARAPLEAREQTYKELVWFTLQRAALPSLLRVAKSTPQSTLWSLLGSQAPADLKDCALSPWLAGWIAFEEVRDLPQDVHDVFHNVRTELRFQVIAAIRAEADAGRAELDATSWDWRRHSRDEATAWVCAYIEASIKQAKVCFPGDVTAQRRWLIRALQSHQEVDDALHPRRLARLAKPLAEGLAWFNGLAANSVTVLYGGIMGLAVYAAFFHFGAFGSWHALTLTLAGLFYASGALAALVLTRGKIKRVAQRIAHFWDKRRMGIKPRFTLRHGLAIACGMLTTVGVSCFAFYSGLYLLPGHGLGGGLLGLFGHVNGMHNLVWLNVLVASLDTVLTFVAAGCLYSDFILGQWCVEGDGIQKPWYERITRTQVMAFGLAALQALVVASRILAVLHTPVLACALIALVTLPLVATFTATFSGAFESCTELLSASSVAPVQGKALAALPQRVRAAHQAEGVSDAEVDAYVAAM